MELSQVFQALRNADAAGDTEAAKRLAQIARGMIAEGDTLDDTKKEKPKETPTVGGQIKEFAKGLVPGAIGLAESAGTGLSALLPDEQERSARKTISSLAASAREPFAAAPGYEETVGRKLGESVGSVAPFLAMGPLGVAGRVGMAGLGVGAGAGEARVRAEQGEASADQRSLATGLGSAVGLTEMFAPARILGRLAAPVQAGAVAAVKRALTAGGEEAAQEAASQVAQNLIAKGIYKPEQAIIEQVGESAAYGGATGALVQGLLDMAIGRRAKGPAAAGAVAAQPTAQTPEAFVPPALGEAEAIPEPTLRVPGVAPEEEEAVAEPTKREAAKQAKAAKDQAARLAKEQAAFLKQYEAQAEERAKAQAEYERVKAMTPEEFFLDQQGAKIPAERPQPSAEEFFINRLGEGPTETEKPLSPLQQYAVSQIQAAQNRPYGFTTEDVLGYLMRDTAQASKLVEERPPIPGLSDTKTDALYNKLKLKVNASLKQSKQAGAAATTAAKEVRLETVEDEEQAALEAQRAEEERIAQDAEIARRVAPERLGIQRLGQEPGRVVLPEGGYASDTGKLLSERFPSKQQEIIETPEKPEEMPLVDQLIQTLPLTNGRITPGRVVEGVGASPSQNLKDLQTQFQIARITRDRKTQEALLTEMRTAKEQGAVEGRGKLTRELQEGMLPEERAQEAAADQHADTQRIQLLGLIKTLDTARTGKLVLPAKREAQISAAKEAFVVAHAAEIEARRKAFGLPEMADWEKAEARARSLEALNELESRYGTFGAPAQAVKVLQGQTRDAVYQNLQNAATRMLEQGQVDLEGKTKKPSGAGPRIAAPDELTLRGEPREAKTEKQRALNVIEMVLRSAETRTRAAPVLEKQEANTLADLAKILAAAKVSGNTNPGFLATGTPTKADAATVDLLTRLRDALETTNDPEFISLAREQATMVAEGNLPNPFAVRDLGEMLKAQEVSGRSAAAPLSKEETAAVARGEKLTFTDLEGKTRTKNTEAQPQLEMFPEAGAQVARATPSNFQKLLDSKDVQGMRDAIQKQRADNLAALQSVGKALPTITNRYNAAKTKHDKQVKKARETGALALGWKDEMRSDLEAVRQEAQDARNEHIVPLQQALREIDDVKAAVLQEPSDMRTLLKINNLLAQEPALRKKLADLEAVVTPLEDLAAQIGAEIKAYTDIAQPALKEFEKAQVEADEAKAELDKVTQEKREAERVEKAGAEAEKRRAEQEATAEETRLRQAAQRGREGLGLEGVRLEKDTTQMRQEMSKIRRAIGSLNDQLDKATNEDTKAELRQKIADQESKLENVFQNAPLVKTELRTREDEEARRDTEDRRAAAEAVVAARRRKAKGEKAPKLKPVKQASLVKEVLGSRVTQPRPQVSLEEVGVAVTNRLMKVNTDLADVQRRMQFLRSTGKAKVKGKLTPLMKDLEAKEATLKGTLSALRQRQSKVTGAAKAATLTYTKAKEAEENLELKAERKGVFRTSIQAGPGMQSQQVKRLVDRILSDWAITPEVSVVENESELPQRIQDQAAKDGVTGRIPGVYDPNTKTVYLVASNLHTGNDVGLTIAHEVAGHFGLREMLGGTYAKTMNSLYDGNVTVRREADAKMGANKNLSREVAVEEVLADMAETGAEPTADSRSALRRLFETIKQWFSNTFGVKGVTDNEVRQIVANARKYVQEGVGALGGEAATGEATYRTAKAPGFEDALATTDQLIAKPKSIGQQIQSNLGLAGRTQWLDRLAPLEKIAREMADPFKGTRMMYYLRMADQKMSFVQQSVARGVPQLVDHKRADGQIEKLIESVEGPNLAGVVETLKGAPGMNAEAANRLFTLYLANKRAENPNVGYDKLNYGISKEQIQRAASQIDSNPEVKAVFEKARKQYNEYNRSLMKFMEDTGALSPEEAKRLAATNDYIPYYRERNGNAELVIGGEGTFKVGNLKDQPQLQQLIGGDQKIYDFLTSSVQNTSVLLDAALRNQATKNTMIDLVDMGLGRFISPTSGPDVVSFKLKGEDKYVLVETDKTGIPADLLVKGMAGIPVNNSAIVRAMGYAATMVRKGVMLSPLYPVRQLFRDSVAAPILSGANFTPIMGAIRQLGGSATKEKLEARGITGGQVFTGTNEDLTRILKDFQDGKLGLSQLVARAEGIAMEADAATRRAQYNSYINQGLSEMEATLMSLESMNFNRKGLSPSARFLSTAIPFFNAQVQSLDVLYRALTGKMPLNERLDIQGKLLRRGALLSGTAIAYAMLMQDDEAYKNATPEQKYGNFFVRIPGLDEPLRIPVPFEIGYIFKGIPEALVNSMANERGAEEAYKAFKSIAIQTIPGGTSLLMPALAKPIIENVANYSFFTERPLESRAEQQMLPEYRFRDNTSEVAKQIGMLTGTSPLKIENLVRGYTGTMGLALAQSLNFAMPSPPKGTPEQATKRLSDTPVIGSMFQPNDAAGIVSATYDRMQEVQQIDKTFKDMVKDGRMSEAREFLQKNSKEIAAGAVAGNIQEQLSTITKAMNAIKASNLTPDKKREELDKLQQLRIKLAESARGYLG
jgi:hypothetical protein